MKAGSKFKRLPRQAFCHFCGKQRPGLLICQRCEMVHYCSREHQIADHPCHSTNCRLVAKCIKEVSEEAERLRDLVWDMDPYGKFFTIPETRNYMRAQMSLGRVMGSFNTPYAVNAQLELLLKLCRLAREDNGLVLRTVIPGLMLRLSKDQECYDFLKWWGTTPIHSPCFTNIYLPYLDLKDSYAYEDYRWIFSGSSFELSMVVALLLIKIRLFLDLQLLQRTFSRSGTNGSPSQAKDNQQALDSSIVETATQDTCQQMPAIQKAAENGSVNARPRNESASPQPRDPQMNAQKHGSMVSGNDTTGTTKIFERDKTNGTKSQFLKPLSADVARIIPCLRSNIVINHLQQIQNFDHTLQIAQLEIDISELYTIINQINARFWGDLLDPSKAQIANTYCMDPSGMAESFSVVNVSQKSWYETPGAIELVGMLSKSTG
ncbi:hypothetical protein MCOR27_002617 [Pyricularia oryzae]|uniref:MYND-type domain-containing protein n=1 Tax=Pyricularia grisea TaxID=148305 RepID=A0ABQ8N434_PYRGI|nr:hypothetical protein MCOR27_002617 [Pyricularia oryzae]KAI6290907.1 hypothetical protein MCOR33_010966 [Pyricularia grisea]KAI6315637.1 hypothetical protein MCOR30_009620 [Pyricularia oryzae]KAI6341357.1 hypothetical protein MCOR28_006053 [Pyricularia oryzae]KAI6368597.1 hypothetical protein MCOR31_005521 [Pyricularia oryzae]